MPRTYDGPQKSEGGFRGFEPEWFDKNAYKNILNAHSLLRYTVQNGNVKRGSATDPDWAVERFRVPDRRSPEGENPHHSRIPPNRDPS